MTSLRRWRPEEPGTHYTTIAKPLDTSRDQKRPVDSSSREMETRTDSKDQKRAVETVKTVKRVDTVTVAAAAGTGRDNRNSGYSRGK